MASFLIGAVVAVVVGLAASQLAAYTTTIYLHRSLAHRAMVIRNPLRFAMRVGLWMTTGIVPRQWVAVHRKHHAFTDEPGDPHSPRLLGWKRVQASNYWLYRKEARDQAVIDRYAKDLPPDLWDKVLFDHPILGLGLGIALLVWLLGPWVGIAAAVIHTVTYIQLNSAVNAIGHTFGKRPYPNSATNLQWLAWITGGEGLHNNHHAAPTSATMRLRKGEIDPAWPFIWLGSKVGLIRIRLQETKFVGRPKRPATA
jgi:stearoyl-CoA desaturase (delta-9 desaturase)